MRGLLGIWLNAVSIGQARSKVRNHHQDCERVSPASPAKPSGEDNRVTYRRGALTEWYVNEPTGLEQGFALAEPPGEGIPRGTLRLELRLDAPFRAQLIEDGAAIRLVDQKHGVRLRYDELHAWDAAGREIPARMTADDRAIAILVDDRDADRRHRAFLW